mmetsp:Transcript_15859/g.30663  ORF Transcript_15859/g.30663 Transcript_15859/m.30663 type:complete len:103 (-) Transcript_15859:113-421(-)
MSDCFGVKLQDGEEEDLVGSGRRGWSRGAGLTSLEIDQVEQAKRHAMQHWRRAEGGSDYLDTANNGPLAGRSGQTRERRGAVQDVARCWTTTQARRCARVGR